MNSIEDYNPDQHENDERYWKLAKKVYKLEETIAKTNKPDKDGETDVGCDPDTIEGMTDRWVFDQLTTISECLKLIVDNGRNQIKVNKRTDDTIKKLNKVIGDMAEKSKANHTKKDSFGGASSSNRDVANDKYYIRTVDDFDWEMDEKGSFAFSGLVDPDDGLRTDGLNDPANAEVGTSKLTKAMGPTIVNPIGREYSYCIDGDRLEYIIHLMVQQDYHPATIRYDDRGVNLVFSKNDNTMGTKTLHLDRI